MIYRSQIMGLMLSTPYSFPFLGLPWRSLTIPSQDIVLMIFILGLLLLSFPTCL